MNHSPVSFPRLGTPLFFSVAPHPLPALLCVVDAAAASCFLNLLRFLPRIIFKNITASIFHSTSLDSWQWRDFKM
jgi:hypothetical protein